MTDFTTLLPSGFSQRLGAIPLDFSDVGDPIPAQFPSDEAAGMDLLAQGVGVDTEDCGGLLERKDTVGVLAVPGAEAFLEGCGSHVGSIRQRRDISSPWSTER